MCGWDVCIPKRVKSLCLDGVGDGGRTEPKAVFFSVFLFLKWEGLID